MPFIFLALFIRTTIIEGYFTIMNNQDNSIKMKARFVGVNPASKKSQWLSELPENSPGLRDADVQKWTSEAVKNYIKQMYKRDYQY